MAKINANRFDLSNWIIHFVHDRKSEDDPTTWGDSIETPDGFRLPDYIDSDGKPIFMLEDYIEKEYEIPEDADAFMVLQKIIHDGFIHSSWSLRNFKPTIYGPSSAVCFTEMPLYALIDYAKERGCYSGYVGNFGIAFKRNELFSAGARPVIYGLSTKHVESDVDDNTYPYRKLSTTETDIGLREQYRYVATNLTKDKEKQINWTMEREWRWAVKQEPNKIPGLPFFLSKEYADYFTNIVIIVETNSQQQEICEQLRNQYDAGTRNCGIEYNKETISNARVVSLESLAGITGDLSMIRIDDIPYSRMKGLPKYQIPNGLKDSIENCILNVEKINAEAIKDYKKEHPEYEEDKDWFGFANVYTCVFTPTTQAMVEMGLAVSYSEGEYMLILPLTYRTDALTLLEKGADAVSKYLTKELGQDFYTKSRPD